LKEAFNMSRSCKEYEETVVGKILDTFLGKTAAAMRMSEDMWMRHANPWSFATRLPLLLLLTVACWSRVWIGWYFLIPLTGVVVWAYLNPRVFQKPRSTRNWASKGVFGEKILVNRRFYCVEIPEHHLKAAFTLTILSLAGAVALAYGVMVLEPISTVAGCCVAYLGKLWYVDRMVWLFEDLRKHPEFAKWVY